MRRSRFSAWIVLAHVNGRSCPSNRYEPHPISAPPFDLPKPPAIRGPLDGSLRSKRERLVRDSPKSNRTISANASAENLVPQSAFDASTLWKESGQVALYARRARNDGSRSPAKEGRDLT